MEEENKETYMLTVNRRNKLWNLIQKAYDRRIDEEVSRILADGHAIGRDMLDTLKDIDERTAELENCKTAWERFLHNGKTMQDINKEWSEKFGNIFCTSDSGIHGKRRHFERSQEIRPERCRL